MSADKHTGSFDLKACLQDQMTLVEDAGYLFSKLQVQLSDGPPDASAFHPIAIGFVSSHPGCFTQVTYLKTPDSDDLDHFVAEFPESEEMTLATLESIWGKFNQYPPSPARIWSAMVAPFPGEFSHPYTLIVKSNAPFDSKTAIQEVAIRIDR
jgi:hypothetical protein